MMISFIIINIAANAQTIYSASIDFEHNNSAIKIDNSQPNNHWQIGRPSKIIFDSALTMPFAIVTDTLHNYPANNTSSFQIDVVPTHGACWGVGNLHFAHKYDTRLHKDGCFVEIKYEGDTNWTNIILDTIDLMASYHNNFYSITDTITGGIPAFSGSSNGWQGADFEWIWFMGVKSFYHDTLSIRFTFKSDSVQTNKEGWMIDDIDISINWCTGGVETFNVSKPTSSIVPNPVCDDSYLELQNYHNQPYDIIIYNEMGTKVRETDNVIENKYLIRNSDFRKGIYFYQILSAGKKNGEGKFIVED